MKKYRVSAFVAMLVLLNMSFSVAQPEQRRGIFRNILTTFEPLTHDQEQNIADALDLTADQRAKMKEVSDRYRKDAGRLVSRYNTLYEDVVALAKSANPSSNVVNEKLKAFHQTHQEVLQREVGYWTDFKSILTPAQNKRFWNIFAMSRVRH